MRCPSVLPPSHPLVGCIKLLPAHQAPHAQVIKLISQVIADFADGEIGQQARHYDTTLTIPEYMDKSFYKTATLIAASCKSAAVFSGLSQQDKDSMFEYGRHLGLAFQVVDDILDFTQTAEQLGKPKVGCWKQDQILCSCADHISRFCQGQLSRFCKGRLWSLGSWHRQRTPPMLADLLMHLVRNAHHWLHLHTPMPVSARGSHRPASRLLTHPHLQS